MKQQLERYKKRVHTKKRCLENCKKKTATEALIKMSGTESLLQDNTSTESDSGDTGVATQTDPVSSVHASTSKSTHCVSHEATMTDMTGSYLEALEQECLQATCRSLGTNSQWSQSAFVMIIRSNSTLVFLVSAY